MSFAELLVIGLALSADAFAVSVTNGLCMMKIKKTQMLQTAFAFGFFQGFMPFLGYVLGNAFYTYISRIDHWIALIFLGVIGAKAIVEAIGEKDEECTVKPFSYSLLFVQAVATSIDAFVVGITLAAMGADIMLSISIIAVVTFVISYIGIWIGKLFGAYFGKKAEIIGGVLLILLGVKIFVEHTFLK